VARKPVKPTKSAPRSTSAIGSRASSRKPAPILPGVRARQPLITPRAAGMLKDLQEHPDAPRWNYTCGDRIAQDDLEALDAFREALFAQRKPGRPGPPGPALIQRYAELIPKVEWLRSRIPPRADLERDWETLPTMTREDLAVRIGEIMPDGCDLTPMVVYNTSGTTGHRIDIPNTPRGASSYMALLDYALAQHGVKPKFNDGQCGSFLLCAQAQTIMYAAVHAVWENSGFAKLNLNASVWPAEKAARYCKEFNPPVLCGDPVSFSEMRRLGLPLKPKALLSTAMSLSPALKQILERTYKCAVIDTYSSNETGLIAYTCTQGCFHILPHDLHVELLAPDGRQVKAGARGEIAVTGGRNPYVPLFRYRTGDWARLESAPCKCGDAAPRLLDFEGRPPVLFRSASGAPVNNVDISRVLRMFPIVQHRFTQNKAGACELVARAMPGVDAGYLRGLEQALKDLLGKVPLKVRFDEKLGEAMRGGKVVPYASEMTLER